MSLGRPPVLKKRVRIHIPAGARGRNVLTKPPPPPSHQSTTASCILSRSPKLAHVRSGLLCPSPNSILKNSPTPSAPSLNSPLELHHILQFSFIPGIHFDVRWSPDILWTHYHSLHKDVLDEPATVPPVAQLHLVSPSLLWGIDVLPTRSNHRGEYYVSVLDVLRAIYTSLKTAITHEEFARYARRPYGATIQKRAIQAYEERCRRSGLLEAREAKRKQGMRRVDFLLGRTRFLGLARSRRAFNELVLYCD